jgi:hypothetical protein
LISFELLKEGGNVPTEISKILMGYKKALDISRSRYEDMYKQRFRNANDFYYDFFNNLVINYGKELLNQETIRSHLRLIKHFFGTDKIKFIAVDGTCDKKRLEDYMVFFGASYAIRGTIDAEGMPPKIKYEKWSTEEDVSMVAYVPIPFAELGNVLEDQFVTSDDNRINLSSIHVLIMQLAEIYLLYSMVKSGAVEPPKLLLWDHSMSSVLASTDIGVNNINMIGYRHMGRTLTIQDAIIAYSHPYNEELDIPSPKEFRMYNFVLRELQKRSPQTLSEIAERGNVSKERLLKKTMGERSLHGYILGGSDKKSEELNNQPIIFYDDNDETFH